MSTIDSYSNYSYFIKLKTSLLRAGNLMLPRRSKELRLVRMNRFPMGSFRFVKRKTQDFEVIKIFLFY